MTQAAKRPSTAARSTGGGRPTLKGHGQRGHDLRGEHDLRDEQGLVSDRDRDDGNERDDRTQRDERDSHDERSERRAHREQDARREDRADDHDARTERDGRDTRDERSDRRQRAERGERDHRVRAVTSNPAEVFTAAPDMSKVVTAWFDMTGDMIKLQQQSFASMLGARNTNNRNTTGV